MRNNNSSTTDPPRTLDPSTTYEVCRWCSKGPTNTPAESVTLYPCTHSNVHLSCLYNAVHRGYDPLDIRCPTCNRTVADAWAVSARCAFAGGFLPVENWQPRLCTEYFVLWLDAWYDEDWGTVARMIEEMRACKLTRLGWERLECRRFEHWYEDEREGVKTLCADMRGFIWRALTESRVWPQHP